MGFKLVMIQVINDERNSFGDQIVTLSADYVNEVYGTRINTTHHEVNHEGNHRPLREIVSLIPKTIVR